jgi:hypothetical protein
VVGERDVLVTLRLGRLDHLGDRPAAVGVCRVHLQIAPQAALPIGVLRDDLPCLAVADEAATRRRRLGNDWWLAEPFVDLSPDEGTDRDELRKGPALGDEVRGLHRPQQRPARRAPERALFVSLARLGGACEELGELAIPEGSADSGGGSTPRAPSSVRASALGCVVVGHWMRWSRPAGSSVAAQVVGG